MSSLQPRSEEIQSLQTQKFATGNVDIGAPILDVAITKAPSLQRKGVSAADEVAESIVKDKKVKAKPSQIFKAFLKETMQFVLGKNFSKGYVMMDTTSSDGEGSVIDL